MPENTFRVDDTDLRLMEMLVEDPDISNVRLAQALSLSPRTVANRLSALITNRVFKIAARLDIRLLGYEGLSIVRIQDPSAKLIAALRKLRWILIATRAPAENCLLAVACNNDMRTFCDDVYAVIRKLSPNSSCFIAQCVQVFKYHFNAVSFPEETNGDGAENLFREPFHQHCDETDFQIVSRLVHDGRKSNRQIGREINLSENAVRMRLSALQDQKLFQMGALVDSASRYSGYLIYEGELDVNPSRFEAVVACLREDNRITFLAQTTGSCNLLFNVLLEGYADLIQFCEALAAMAEVRTMRPVLGQPEVFRYEYMYVT